MEHGELESTNLIHAVEQSVAAQPLARLQYIEIVDPEQLTPMRILNHEARALLAVFIGQTRLIDNVPLLPKAPPPPGLLSEQ